MTTSPSTELQASLFAAQSARVRAVFVVDLACMACGRGRQLTVAAMADLPPMPQRCEACAGSVLATGSARRLVRDDVQKIQRKPFTQDETVRLVQAASAGPNPIRDRALLLLMFDTGARVGEICSATLDDVDLVAGSITFERTKNGRPRTVGFRVQAARDGGPCLQALKNWLKMREARPGIEALFTTRERLPMSTRRVRELFEEFGKAARVPGAIPHRARHTSASEFLAERPGAEIQLRSRLGQVSDEVLRDYVTISDTTAQSAADAASLSTKWNLGSRSNGARPPSRKQAGRKQAPTSRPAPAVDSAAIVEAVRNDPELRKALLQRCWARHETPHARAPGARGHGGADRLWSTRHRR